ncbi:hypothetical protein PUN28_007135 [Cardiocondyla obscurior]|uniref:Uncharacterized protein n=1 Tax=Cardiocondyla obscurior TaxID=286306 RepID=A0AAW2G3Z9_9HYME
MRDNYTSCDSGVLYSTIVSGSRALLEGIISRESERDTNELYTRCPRAEISIEHDHISLSATNILVTTGLHQTWDFFQYYKIFLSSNKKYSATTWFFFLFFFETTNKYNKPILIIL